ncbi:hypothetical protein [Levilactobacillus parabrevis]|uniref:hypothetical protein n=1 Tax=Levilactobacillus parabrevis TaxID=357278 RepID=UPI0021A88FB5|nr:hypothetical protein [Levilactobacillus parabrevis]
MQSLTRVHAPTANKDDDEKVANAAIVTQGKFGTVNFYLTDQGDLHLGAGQLPEHEVTPGDSGRGQLLQAVARAYYNDLNLLKTKQKTCNFNRRMNARI